MLIRVLLMAQEEQTRKTGIGADTLSNGTDALLQSEHSRSQPPSSVFTPDMEPKPSQTLNPTDVVTQSGDLYYDALAPARSSAETVFTEVEDVNNQEVSLSQS